MRREEMDGWMEWRVCRGMRAPSPQEAFSRMRSKSSVELSTLVRPASAIGEATSKADPAILATVVGMGVSPGLVP